MLFSSVIFISYQPSSLFLLASSSTSSAQAMIADFLWYQSSYDHGCASNTASKKRRDQRPAVFFCMDLRIRSYDLILTPPLWYFYFCKKNNYLYLFLPWSTKKGQRVWVLVSSLGKFMSSNRESCHCRVDIISSNPIICIKKNRKKKMKKKKEKKKA